jgi:hypothetical protein
MNYFILHYLNIPVINVLFYSYLLIWGRLNFCNGSGEMSVQWNMSEFHMQFNVLFGWIKKNQNGNFYYLFKCKCFG